MDNEDQFKRSLDELLQQIIEASENSEESVEDQAGDELLDLITSEVDPDVLVCIQHEVNKAMGKLIPVLHRHVMTSVTTNLQTYSGTVTGEVQRVMATYSRSVSESVDELRAEITKLRRTGRWLTGIVIVSWILLIGMILGGIGVYGSG